MDIKELIPLRDIVLFKEIQQPGYTTKSGLLMTQDMVQLSYGEVISVGEDVKNINPGDTILHGNIGDTSLVVEGESYKCIKSERVIFVIRKK